MSTAWTHREAPFLLRELLRVLEPGGVLIAAVPMEANAKINLSALLKSSGLTDDDSPDKTDIANFFSLQKKIKEPIQLSVSRDEEVWKTNILGDTKIELFGYSTEKLQNEINNIEMEIESQFDIAFDHFEKRDAIARQSWEIVAKAVSQATHAHGWIECRANFCDDYCRYFLLKGWSATEDWGCWSEGATSQILLPLTPNIEDGETLEIELDFVVLHCEGRAPVTLVLSMANRSIKTVSCESENLVRVEIPANSIDCAAFALLQLDVSATTRPSVWGVNANDHRELGIGLRRFRYRTVRNTSQIPPSETSRDSRRRRFPFLA